MVLMTEHWFPATAKSTDSRKISATTLAGTWGLGFSAGNSFQCCVEGYELRLGDKAAQTKPFTASRCSVQP